MLKSYAYEKYEKDNLASADEYVGYLTSLLRIRIAIEHKELVDISILQSRAEKNVCHILRKNAFSNTKRNIVWDPVFVTTFILIINSSM